MHTPARDASDRDRPVVVCPLRFEQNALMRAGLGRRCDLCCCGPGPEPVSSWARRIEPKDRPVILAGLAGALKPDRLTGTAWIIAEIRLPQGKAIIPPWPGPATGHSAAAAGTAVVTSSAAPVHRAADKAELAGQTGADLVDLESAAFAAAAASRGWRWGIVRGVSDAADSDIPAGMETWVDGGGRLRWLTVLAAVIRRPTLAGTLLRLRRDAGRALEAVAGRIEAGLE